MKTVKLPNIKSSANNSAGRSMLENWFPGWVGWYSSAPTESESAEAASSEAKQLEGEILQVLSDSVENNTIFKRDAVFGKFNFCLKKGSINLCTTMDGETLVIFSTFGLIFGYRTPSSTECSKFNGFHVSVLPCLS